MRWLPKVYGGHRMPTERLKRDGWQDQHILVVSADDQRLSWPEREFIRHIGEKLYGKQETRGVHHA